MARKPFKLVFKRGGDTPKEWTSKHATIPEAAAKAGELKNREVSAGWGHVQLWYELWNEDGEKVRETVVQKGKR